MAEVSLVNGRRLPSLNGVRSFEAAARHLSFTRAARELSVTQGAVSRAVQALEGDLGMKLFHRQGPALRLTPAGSAYLPHVTEALERIALATRSLRRLSDGGVLSISVLSTFALRWLVPRLNDFQTQNPDLLVDVSTTERFVDFATEPVDVAVRYGLGHWPNTEATFFMREDVGVFCLPALAARLRKPADLRAHVLLQHITRAGAWADYFEAFCLSRPNLRQAPAFEHFFMVIEAAAAGMGVALLPVFLAQADVDSGRLVQPFPQTISNKKSYYIVHAPGAGKIRKIRLFKEWLLARVAASGDVEKENVP